MDESEEESASNNNKKQKRIIDAGGDDDATMVIEEEELAAAKDGLEKEGSRTKATVEGKVNLKTGDEPVVKESKGKGDVEDSGNDNENRICRFCFDGDEDEDDENDKLISPCNCKGGQKYIHLKCLRRWQRMVLVSQPTHPEFWEDDIRHRICNVCKADFTCKPPTRKELMEGFTGPEIASLIEVGCIIASHEGFNTQLEERLNENPIIGLLSSARHWLRGVYLITKVEEDHGEIEYPLNDEDDFQRLLRRLDDDLCLETIDGNKYKLQTTTSTTTADGDDTERQNNRRSFGGLTLLQATNINELRIHPPTLPCSLVFKPIATATTSENSMLNCNDDKVAAINITRPLASPTGSVSRIVSKIIKETKTENVNVTYFEGGPCDDDMIVRCIVMGGRRTGYTIVERDFRTAMLLAKRNAINAKKDARRNNIAVGQDVTITELQKKPELNGKHGLVQAFIESQERFEVRLYNNTTTTNETTTIASGDDQVTSTAAAVAAPTGSVNANTTNNIIHVKPINLLPHPNSNNNGTVYAFIGDARWTRAQLLGEIAKSSWGLCQSRIEDIVENVTPPSERYNQVLSRLVYAPISEMSEEYARNQTIQLRRGAMEAAQYVQGNTNEDGEAENAEEVVEEEAEGEEDGSNDDNDHPGDED